MNAKLRSFELANWLWPLACFITLTGYFGSWVEHPVAGLAITGLDLGEYVKFLPGVREGEVTVWRQGFYLPLAAVSMSCSLLAYRRAYAYAFVVRLALLLLGVVAALNLLPPAWSPVILWTNEFRLQTATMLISLVMVGLSPLLALLPSLPVYAFIALLSLAGIWYPTSGFLRILPSVSNLYDHGLRPGWAFYVLIAGLGLLVAACWVGWKRER